MLANCTNVLAIGAHTDDIELGCGGLLSRISRNGGAISVMAFSRAEASLPKGSPEDTLELEFQSSMSHIAPKSIWTGRIPVRNFPFHRQEILDEMVSVARALKPDLVITMSGNDTHQDHEVIHAESVRAFRRTNLIAYEIPWNQRIQQPNMFVELEEQDMQRKIAMLSCYQSQRDLKRGYVGEDYPISAAKYRGHQIGAKYAEAYETISLRW